MTDSLIAEAVRNRDELWCRCLCATLDPREIAEVLGVFNSVRPDKPKKDEAVLHQAQG